MSTNYDRIMSMSKEELTDFFIGKNQEYELFDVISDDFCQNVCEHTEGTKFGCKLKDCVKMNDREVIMQWLNHTVEDGGNHECFDSAID